MSIIIISIIMRRDRPRADDDLRLELEGQLEARRGEGEQW